MKRSVWTVFGIIAILVAFAAVPANATISTITHLNSSISVDDASQAGMFSWVVNGVDQMFQQWFWYRIGTTGGESAINTISAANTTAGGRLIDVDYNNGSLEIDVTYLLTGGTAGSNTSDVAETIAIMNHGNSAIDFHFFQYADFDLNGTSGDQTVTFTSTNTVQQQGPGGGILMTETVVTPQPSHHTASLFPTTLNLLNDGSPTTFDDVSSAGPGDAVWGFQWDVVIGAGGTFIISKDKHLDQSVPEPASVILFGSLLLGVACTMRRRAVR